MTGWAGCSRLCRLFTPNQWRSKFNSGHYIGWALNSRCIKWTRILTTNSVLPVGICVQIFVHTSYVFHATSPFQLSVSLYMYYYVINRLILPNSVCWHGRILKCIKWKMLRSQNYVGMQKIRLFWRTVQKCPIAGRCVRSCCLGGAVRDPPHAPQLFSTEVPPSDNWRCQKHFSCRFLESDEASI